LVDNAPICSLSLGVTRKFQLRHRSDSDMGRVKTVATTKRRKGEPLTSEEEASVNYEVGVDPELNCQLDLSHGDLVVMGGTLQKFWRHRLPVMKHVLEPRLAFTFRLAKSKFFITQH